MAQVRSASVVDFSAPKLQIELEQPLDIDKVKLDVEGWRVSQWDLFYFVRPTSAQVGRMPSVSTIAAEFNTKAMVAVGRGVGPVIPCILDEGTTAWSLYVPVGFARAVVRRFCPEWRIVLSEHYARKSLVAYVLDQKDPQCSHVLSDQNNLPSFCWDRPAPYLVDKKAHHPLYLCETHKGDRNRDFAARRTGNK